MIKFTIPGVPRTKKNSMRMITRGGKTFPIPSAAFAEYQNNAGIYIPFRWQLMDKPMNVKCTYYMDTRRKVDLLNLLGATCDILTHYGVIKDDSSDIVVSHDGSRVMYDKLNPRVEIEIEEVSTDATS
jgi:Holliday junction resolvase RusA-like endonuclease